MKNNKILIYAIILSIIISLAVTLKVLIRYKVSIDALVVSSILVKNDVLSIKIINNNDKIMFKEIDSEKSGKTVNIFLYATHFKKLENKDEGNIYEYEVDISGVTEVYVSDSSNRKILWKKEQ